MNSEPENQIEILLSRRDGGSIVDSLFALPAQVSTGEQTNEWDRAVNSRMEAVLANQLRSLIGKDQRNAA
jgi:hypothetical protein